MTLKHLILAELEQRDEIEGTEHFANMIGARNKVWLRSVIRSIEKIVIISSRGGRGRKTVYRINRNSPGYRRKVR